MMPLPLLITFSQSLASIDENEFDQFLDKVVQQYGRDLLRTALFMRFSSCEHKSNQSTTNEEILRGLLDIVNDIITTRDESMDSDDDRKEALEEKESVPILSLSESLIGGIGSFLDQRSNYQFGKCHSIIYIGLNSPNTLQELSLLNIDECEEERYALVDLRRYPLLHTLRLFVDDYFFNHLQFPTNEKVCKRLRSIEIFAEGDEPKLFTESTAISFENIIDVKLSYASDDEFFNLISKFPKCERLYYETYRSNVWDRAIGSRSSELLAHLPNLKALIVAGPSSISFGPIKEMICIFSSQLKGLAIRDTKEPMDVVIPADTKFASLEELELISASCVKTLLPIVRKSTNSLKRLHLIWVESEAQQIIDLLAEQNLSRLNQLVISGELKDIEGICAALERSLFNSSKSKWERESLQIKLWMERGDSSTTIDISEILFNMNRVMNGLHFAAQNDDFLLLWRLKENPFPRDMEEAEESPETKQWKQIMQRFVNQSTRFDMTWSFRDILVTNKSCKISGCIHGYMNDDWLTSDF